MGRSWLVAIALAVPLLAAAPAAAEDFSDVARNIIPSGQYGLPGAGADGQSKQYDALTPLFDQVTTSDLNTDFKSEKLGSDDSCPCTTEVVPRAGVTLVRDADRVPHITGVTRDDVTWAAGYVLSEDRALVLSLGRYPARFAALDAPGVDAFGLVTSLTPATVTPQADALIEQQNTASLMAQGDEGKALLHDIDVYIEGINAQLTASASGAKPFTRADIYSLNALAGQIFGQGGGDEVPNAQLRAALIARLGQGNGERVFDELSNHDDADAPVTDPGSFPYEQLPTGNDTSGNALIDATQPSMRTQKDLNVLSGLSQRHTSNFLMVGKDQSTTGHPLLVGGPQIGYFFPGLTLEMDLHGPGIDARGAAIPGGPGNILIGRGEDLAWSLTSAGGDTNDTFVETLCGSDTKYMYKGECREMGSFDAGFITGRGEVTYRTTVHGPVEGYANVGGVRKAISFARSSRGSDIDWQLMFSRLSQGKVTDPASFFAAAAKSPFTFNVSYLDDQHIATYTAGKLPLRDSHVDPRLPTDGRGDHEWTGFLADDAHPHAVDPASGRLVNWNNRPAQGFGASDAQRDLGSVHRVNLLNQALDAQVAKGDGKVDLAGVTSAMNKAATQDLRATGSTFRALDAVLRSPGPALSARDAAMVSELEAWEASGSSRLDRDLDGTMDAGGAPAIMDALFPRVRDAVLAPVLGPQLPALKALIGENSTASGFTGGGISLVDKDLRTISGETLKAPYPVPLCGKGVLADCRASLVAALTAAGDAIAADQGTEDPTQWTSDATAERISFAPLGAIPTIRYTNRPSGIQQVISFKGHRPLPPTTTTTMPATTPTPTETAPVPVVPPVVPPATPSLPSAPSAPSTSVARAPKVRITFGSFRLTRTGRASVVITCPATTSKLTCLGTVTVKRAGRRIARVSYRVSSGKAVRVAFKAPSALRRSAGRNRARGVKVSVQAVNTAATTGSTAARSARLRPLKR